MTLVGSISSEKYFGRRLVSTTRNARPSKGRDRKYVYDEYVNFENVTAATHIDTIFHRACPHLRASERLL